MTDLTSADARNRQIAANFNAVAATYDQLDYLQVCAERLIALTPLSAGARVLDVATGTGIIALLAADRVGPSGTVVGVDLSPEMLNHARQKLAHSGLTHVSFLEGDAAHLNFPDQSFDVILCASSLFFMPDMLAALREWRRLLVPGGLVGFSSFGPTFLQPLRSLWEARLRHYGLTPAVLPTQRLDDPLTCRTLVEEAGLTQIEVHSEQLGYSIPTAQTRWAHISAGPEGKPLLHLPLEKQQQAQAEYLAEITQLSTADGIWVDIPAIFTFGKSATLA